MADVKWINNINISCGIELLETFEQLPQRAKELLFSFVYEETEKNNGKTSLLDLLVMYGFDPDRYESPIETIYALAVFCVLSQLSFPESEIFYPFEQEKIKIGKKTYRVDFLFDTSTITDKLLYREHNYKLAVECDGHLFHKRTRKKSLTKTNVIMT